MKQPPNQNVSPAVLQRQEAPMTDSAFKRTPMGSREAPMSCDDASSITTSGATNKKTILSMKDRVDQMCPRSGKRLRQRSKQGEDSTEKAVAKRTWREMSSKPSPAKRAIAMVLEEEEEEGPDSQDVADKLIDLFGSNN